MLLDSRAIRLVMSKEFVRKHKFRRTKLERLIYMRNIDKILNYVKLIVDIVEVKLFFKRIYKKNIDRCDRRSEVECNIRDTMAGIL